MNNAHNTLTRPPRHSRVLRRQARLAMAALGIVALAACGSDDAKSANTSADTTASTTAPTTVESTAATTGGSTSGGDDLTGFCAVANELNDSEEFPPSADLLTRYTELLPAELSDESAAVQPLIAATTDPVAFFNALAQDELEDAVASFDSYEEANCGIDHDDAPTDGSSMETEPGIPTIEVVATDYAFAAPPRATRGRTSFRLTNDGKEAHFLSLNKLKDGVTLEEAMMSEDPAAVTEGSWDTNLAAAGGEDEEVITVDLEPGTYALFCFIPGPTGEPHAFMGMQAQIIVS